MSSPTQRSLEYAREQRWPAAVTERWNAHARRRVDLFGCIDLIVLDDAPGILGVQACAGASHADRASKVRRTISGEVSELKGESWLADALRKANALQRWLDKGNRIEVWSWSKKGARGKRKLWELRREAIEKEAITT